MARSRSELLRLRLLLWRMRPLLLACAALLGCVVVARQLAPGPGATEAVVVAARDIAAGASVTGRDVRVVQVPSHLVPDGALGDPAAVIDRQVPIDIPRGLPVVELLLGSERFALSPPPGTVAVPIRLVDAAVASLLRPGDRVDLVMPAATDWATPAMAAPEVLAHSALVLEVVIDDSGSGFASLGGGPVSEPVTVVAVSEAEGHRLAASAWGSLGAVLVG